MGVNIRESLKYKKWRSSVFRRDEYTCQRCKVRGGPLEAHHIFNFSEWVRRRFSLRNGITLCINCHEMFHIIYGKSKNNKIQLDEFLATVE